MVSGRTIRRVPQTTASANRHRCPTTFRRDIDKLKLVVLARLIKRGTANATKNVSSITLALSQQETPMSAPAAMNINRRGLLAARAIKNIANRIGSTEIASGRSRTEFQANCGEKALSNPATTPALNGCNSATIKRIITAARASQIIWTNWTDEFDDPRSAMRIE